MPQHFKLYRYLTEGYNREIVFVPSMVRGRACVTFKRACSLHAANEHLVQVEKQVPTIDHSPTRNAFFLKPYRGTKRGTPTAD